ncbi:uncharacterized protein LOC143208160 [Lasioglossum baleicum]|uniref:uncharacterized protein LOC143208160 n=1 Tax=Lasioglossum baleicum TaxID=434251 RepID=UPI003FCD595A
MSKRIQWKQREKELMTEIERLTKQVEFLTLEVDRLKDTRTSECHETPSRVVMSDIPSRVVNGDIPSPAVNSDIPSRVVNSDIPSPAVKVCHCKKGKCATKRCACVKSHTSCSKLCKCSSNICQNKEKNDEEQNKENLENITVVARNVARRRGLSRTVEDQETRFQDVEKNIEEMVLQKEHNETPEDNFDPMKPKHQLVRTPPKDKKFVHSHSDSSALILTPDNIEVKEEKKTEEELQVPEEFNQPEVDWEKYQAQLVPCNKCKRKFHPNRVEKHQKCCKKV